MLYAKVPRAAIKTYAIAPIAIEIRNRGGSRSNAQGADNKPDGALVAMALVASHWTSAPRGDDAAEKQIGGTNLEHH